MLTLVTTTKRRIRLAILGNRASRTEQTINSSHVRRLSRGAAKEGGKGGCGGFARTGQFKYFYDPTYIRLWSYSLYIDVWLLLFWRAKIAYSSSINFDTEQVQFPPVLMISELLISDSRLEHYHLVRKRLIAVS
jgi:hypothetical protein